MLLQNTKNLNKEIDHIFLLFWGKKFPYFEQRFFKFKITKIFNLNFILGNILNNFP
jgi:hypothetical protein